MCKLLILVVKLITLYFFPQFSQVKKKSHVAMVIISSKKILPSYPMNISNDVMYVELNINNFHFFSVICIERLAWGEGKRRLVHHIINNEKSPTSATALLLHGIRLFLINNYEAKA